MSGLGLPMSVRHDMISEFTVEEMYLIMYILINLFCNFEYVKVHSDLNILNEI